MTPFCISWPHNGCAPREVLAGTEIPLRVASSLHSALELQRTAGYRGPSDGKRSVRYGPHAMNSSPARHHYHEETWSYDAPTDTMTVRNAVIRVPTNQ